MKQSISELAFINGCNSKSYKNNAWFNQLTMLEKLEVIKNGFDTEYKIDSALSDAQRLRRNHYKKYSYDYISEDNLMATKSDYIAILDLYFGKLSASSIKSAMIQNVGVEGKCPKSGAMFREGIMAKAASYIDAYTINLYGALASVEYIDGLEVHEKLGKVYTFLGYPTREQFEYVILRPENVPYITLHINDFSPKKCIDTDKIILNYEIK
jgi:hypothetical protein